MAFKEGLTYTNYVMRPGNEVRACRMNAPFYVRGLRGQLHKGAAGDYIELTANGDVVVHDGSAFEAEFEEADPQVADHVAFFVQPSDVIVNEVIAPSVVVEIRDASNARVLGATDAVTIALKAGSTGTLNGTLTRNAVNGRATFNNLSPDTVQDDKVLRATSGSLTLADSNSFDVDDDTPPDPGETFVRLTQAGDHRVTQAGDTRITQE